jgi:hypothetical protein
MGHGFFQACLTGGAACTCSEKKHGRAAAPHFAYVPNPVFNTNPKTVFLNTTTAAMGRKCC